MIFRDPFNFFNEFFEHVIFKIRSIYLNSNYYDKKISKINSNNLIYKPSPHLLSSLIKYQTKKINVEEISTQNLWDRKNFLFQEFERLNNFYWFFSLDLKSSKKKLKKLLMIG